MHDARLGLAATPDYGLGEGGLLRRLEAACRLTRLKMQILTVVFLTWVPILLLGGIGEVVTGTREPLLWEPALHVRLLVAMPTFLVLDYVFPDTCRRTLLRLADEGFVPEAHQAAFDRAVSRAQRMTDSFVPETLLAFLGLSVGLAALLRIAPIPGIPPGARLTAAQTWFALADLPLFQFLLWRSLWRWLVWAHVLLRVSRLNLVLIPTHPDQRGGLLFLRRPSLEYCAMLLFAVSSVLCAQLSGRFTRGTTLASFKPLAVLFVTSGTFVALGPLLLFTPHLVRLRREGLAILGGKASTVGRQFHQLWLEGARPDLLRREDVQGLSALTQIYRETVDKVRVVLFEKRDLLILGVVTVSPLLPLMLARVETRDWLVLARLFTGGWVP